MNPTFITVGDVTNDAFITLKNPRIACNVSDENCTITLNWGDKIPYEDLQVVNGVGNSANAAVSAARLGLPVGFVSFVGNDKHGEECLEVLQGENVDTSHVSVQEGKKTNYHYVLSYDAERTILVRHEDFSYAFPNLPESVTHIYLSSLGEASEAMHGEIVAYLRNNPSIRLIFQPGTFQMQAGYAKLKEVYESTHLFVCNKQEAQRILETAESDMGKLLHMMRKRGPELVSITDGPRGAFLFDGKKMLFVPQYPDIAPPKERTGAGDAYTSTLATFLAKGHSLDEALLRAPINSMSVVQHVGAQAGLLNEEKLEEYLRNAPKGYSIRETMV